MVHFETIPQGFVLEVPQSGVADVVKGSVIEYLQEWLVVYSNEQHVSPCLRHSQLPVLPIHLGHILIQPHA